MGVALIGALLLLCAAASARSPASVRSPASARSHPSEPSASRYPAGGEGPRRIARPSEFAHSAATGKRTRKGKAKPGLHGNPARALVSFAAMQKAFYIAGSGLYLGQPYSYLWPFSQALAATVSVANIPGQSAKQASSNSRELHVRLYGLGKYWSTPTEASEPLPGEQPEAEEQSGEPSESAGVPPPSLPSYSGNVAPPAGASYYDDNEWVGIELMRAYKLRHEAALLERAEQIMQFVMSGWQTNPKLACVGGVPFSDSPSNTDRNTVTDGPGAELALQLYRVTGDGAYLQFAEMAYEWVRRCLLQPNQLYADHIRQHGVIDPTLWSYNQGSMIGAGTLLYQVTHDGAFLYQARQTATAALGYFTMQRLLSENPFFVSVYLRNQMYLDSVTHDPPGVHLAQDYINYVWVNRRLSNGLFVWASPPSPPSSQLLVQAAAVQVYALLSTKPATYF
ncbi:MAG TPA: glycoside hydrolase family 76 protein [Solirubrobacteraceae bacterium]|nr:glycoside hydrolase family 76 protein [Solirubrobacteraceae bacterium]